jgi:dihydroxyacid dehydratase/phosphogluconate dehydratase
MLDSFCGTMGTATTMRSLAEAPGRQLSGDAAVPALPPWLSKLQTVYSLA